MAELTADTGSVPSPDPTLLTTDALRREITSLKELLFERLDGRQTRVLDKIEALVGQLNRAEAHRLEQKSDTKDAVDAALAAQKEAGDKAEKATEKQLEEIKANISTTVEGLRRELADLKDRIGRAEFGPPPPGQPGTYEQR